VSLLADILASKGKEIAALRRRTRRGALRHAVDVRAALRRGPGESLKLIAEVKLRSPSAGALSRVLEPADRAVAYAEAGAAMVSVLCDTQFFDGSWEHLGAARRALDARATPVALLAKDFVLDEAQIDEARDRGADAILLIARIVPADRLVQLAAAARSRSVEPLIEVVDEREVAAAVAAEARVIGVNVRDLDTLVMDADRGARVLAAVPPGIVAVHFSGIRDPGAVAEVARGRADAALVGEALMRVDDPRPLLRAMVDGARGVQGTLGAQTST
jgi:indole-3-glycerol phosphate synthase